MIIHGLLLCFRMPLSWSCIKRRPGFQIGSDCFVCGGGLVVMVTGVLGPAVVTGVAVPTVVTVAVAVAVVAAVACRLVLVVRRLVVAVLLGSLFVACRLVLVVRRHVVAVPTVVTVAVSVAVVLCLSTEVV
jgi:hypothetical protein